jgi:hypothetical protein
VKRGACSGLAHSTCGLFQRAGQFISTTRPDQVKLRAP